jgi:hypothetical protein
MKKKNVCPCPNLDCMNHGNCMNCTSRHLRIGSLNYCAFYSILDELKQAVSVSPDSPSAQIIKKRIERQTNHYSKCMKKNDISEKHLHYLRIEKSKLSNH